MTERINKIGKQYGQVIIIGIGDSYRISHDHELRYTTKCKCLVCGQKFEVRKHHWPSLSYKDGCKDCASKARAKRQMKPPEHSGFVCLYRGYESRCRDAGREFSLTKEEFRSITKQNCYFCGAPPACISRASKLSENTRHGDYIHSTIDRLDNNKGYVIENSVPSCLNCNLMKREKSEDEFISHVRKILEYQGKKRRVLDPPHESD